LSARRLLNFLTFLRYRPPADRSTSLPLEPRLKRGWFTRHATGPPRVTVFPARPKKTHRTASPHRRPPPPPPRVSPEDQNLEEDNNNTNAQTTQSSSAAPLSSSAVVQSSALQGSQRPEAQSAQEEYYCCGCWENFWSVICCIQRRTTS